MSPVVNCTIIIPCFNAWDYAKACVDSLLPTLRDTDELVLVNDGSTERSPHLMLVSAMTPRYTYVKHGANRGFAVACNSGAALADSGILIFLNSDTILFDGWLDDILEAFDDPDVGAVGPMSNWVSGRQQVSVNAWRVPNDDGLAYGADAYMTAHEGEYERTERLVGFCLAVRASAFREVGGFDEGYEVGGCEDDDLCQKLLAAGYKLLIAHGSFVYHHGHATFDANGIDYAEREQINQVRFMQKWGMSTMAKIENEAA